MSLLEHLSAQSKEAQGAIGVLNIEKLVEACRHYLLEVHVLGFDPSQLEAHRCSRIEVVACQSLVHYREDEALLVPENLVNLSCMVPIYLVKVVLDRKSLSMIDLTDDFKACMARGK